MSKIFAGYHVVFATHWRKPTLPLNRRRLLYSYIHTFLQNNNCTTLRINGIRDHVHIAFDLNPTLALADVIRDLKRSSSHFLSQSVEFPNFEGWGKGYFAETFSFSEKDRVVEYIKEQENHHLGRAFEIEMEWLVTKANMRYFAEDWE